MGNQASDGAYFTRPVAASVAALLTLDALGEQDWTDEETWKVHKTVDLACGSGTLLADRDEAPGQAFSPLAVWVAFWRRPFYLQRSSSRGRSRGGDSRLNNINRMTHSYTTWRDVTY